MFAETDIAARVIWLRNAAYCGPRMVAATRCTFRVNACAFRQTLSFLKSLIPKDGVTGVFTHVVFRCTAAFDPRFATPPGHLALASSEKARSGPRAAA